MTSAEVVPMSVGDTVPVGTILANIHLMGIATDPNVPNMFAATLEAYGDQGVLTVPVLQGPQGPPGQPMFALIFQNDNISSPADLPTDLGNTLADVGKYWIFENLDANNNVVGSSAYIWYGTEFRVMPMGTPGPPGPYPVITPTVRILSPTQNSYVEVSGPASNPSWRLNLALPMGPQGPATALGSAPDVNLASPPTRGQVLGFNGNYTPAGQPIFQPMSIGDIMPRPYTVPESAFQAYWGITGSQQTVCTWSAPAQNWPWQPFIWGQLLVGGLDISFTPNIVGAEVRINDPKSGPLVAVGIGSTTGAVTIVPHTSSSNNPSNAMTPDNEYAKVPAGTSPKVFVNLVNEGLVTAFDYKTGGSQIAMLALPMGTEQALPTTYQAQFGGAERFSADNWSFVT